MKKKKIPVIQESEIRYLSLEELFQSLADRMRQQLADQGIDVPPFDASGLGVTPKKKEPKRKKNISKPKQMSLL
jgi:hypothetical protein